MGNDRWDKGDTTEMSWMVVTHTDFFYKIHHEVVYEHEAKEYAAMILERGDFYSEPGGSTVFIPVNRIMKVRIIPPDTEMTKSKTYLKFTGE